MLSIKQLFKINKKASQSLLMLTAMAFMSTPAFAADAPGPSIFSNPLAMILIVLMGLLLIVIAVLANILIGAADWRLKTGKKAKVENIAKPLTTILLLLATTTTFAQDAPTEAAPVASTIGGLSASTFYVMASVIFLELAIILVLLINIRFLIRATREKEAIALEAATGKKAEAKKSKYSLASIWNRMNNFKSAEQEKDLEMAHEYDGIRELDNRLPPWWLWGFYVTITFAVVYLWRYHVAESAPLSEEEYNISVARAEAEVEAYLKKKGESVNENTVEYLTAADDLAAGLKLYTASCVACHNAKGEGGVGPNLTDEYWLHGGDIKSIFKTIKYGVDGKGMASWQAVYSPKQMAQLASYVKSLGGTNPPGGREPQGVLYREERAASATDSLQAVVKE